MNYLYLESICIAKLTSWITIDDCTSEIRIHSNNAYECQTNTLKHPNMAVDIIINNTVVTFYQMSKSQFMMNSSQWERENEHWIKQLKIRKKRKKIGFIWKESSFWHSNVIEYAFSTIHQIISTFQLFVYFYLSSILINKINRFKLFK